MYEIGDLVRVRTRDEIIPYEKYVQTGTKYYGMQNADLEDLHAAGFLRVKKVMKATSAYGGYFREDIPMVYMLEIPDERYWFDPEFLENMLEPESVGEDLPDPDPESLSEFLAWEGTA